MEDFNAIRKRHVVLMRHAMDLTQHLLAEVSAEAMTTYRDSGDGWTVLEVLCHLRDFEEIFHMRAIMMRDEEMPALPAFDHDQMAIDHNYNAQDPAEVLADLAAKRHAYREFFKALTEAQWQRGGNHPERDRFSMLDALMQVGLHHVNHLEQMTRILHEKR